MRLRVFGVTFAALGLVVLAFGVFQVATHTGACSRINPDIPALHFSAAALASVIVAALWRKNGRTPSL